MSRRTNRHDAKRLRITDWLRVVLPPLALAGFALVAWRLGYFGLRKPHALAAAADRVSGTPWLGPMFVVVYALLAALAFPISPLAYGGGAIFGFWRGALYVWIASMLGGAAGYVLARGTWSGPAHRLLGKHRGLLGELRKGNAILVVLRMQLLPVVPFGVFNYAAAISEVPFVPFLTGTALGVIPGTVAAVLVGDRIAAGVSGNDKRSLVIAALVAAVLLGLSFLPTIVKKLRK